MYVCVCVCVYAYAYICVHTYTHTCAYAHAHKQFHTEVNPRNNHPAWTGVVRLWPGAWLECQVFALKNAHADTWQGLPILFAMLWSHTFMVSMHCTSTNSDPAAYMHVDAIRPWDPFPVNHITLCVTCWINELCIQTWNQSGIISDQTKQLRLPYLAPYYQPWPIRAEMHTQLCQLSINACHSRQCVDKMTTRNVRN